MFPLCALFVQGSQSSFEQAVVQASFANFSPHIAEVLPPPPLWWMATAAPWPFWAKSLCLDGEDSNLCHVQKSEQDSCFAS